MLKIYMAPVTEPGMLTLQATTETWGELAQMLEAHVDTRYRLAVLVRKAIAEADPGTPVRITLPDEAARRCLQVAGVSA